MLSLEIDKSGGVEIRGTKKELLSFSWWIREAAEKGFAEPAFVSDVELASIKIVCESKEGG